MVVVVVVVEVVVGLWYGLSLRTWCDLSPRNTRNARVVVLCSPTRRRLVCPLAVALAVAVVAVAVGLQRRSR